MRAQTAILSFYDPQRDRNPASGASPCVAVLDAFSKVSRYCLLYQERDAAKAKEMQAFLQTRAPTAPPVRQPNPGKQTSRPYRAPPRPMPLTVDLVPVPSKNVWDTAAFKHDLESKLFPPCKECEPHQPEIKVRNAPLPTPDPDWNVVQKLDAGSNWNVGLNLDGGTAQMRTALFLLMLQQARKWDQSCRNGRNDENGVGMAPDRRNDKDVVVSVFKRVNVWTWRKNQGKMDILKPTAPVGLFRDLMGTADPDFGKTLDDLELVLRHASDATHERILLTGPTGAGKSHLANEIIRLLQALDDNIKEAPEQEPGDSGKKGKKEKEIEISGKKAEKPSSNIVRVNVAAFSKNLIENELFGHDKGAYTGADNPVPGVFERADGGVVFLDEIGELPRPLQTKLLTVLDGQPFTRIGGTKGITSRFSLLCGTNRDLEEECRKGHFRRDLFYRIAFWNFRVPGLAERCEEDLHHALRMERIRWEETRNRKITFVKRPEKPPCLREDAEEMFLDLARQIPWDGNFREFHAAFVHIATRSDNGSVTQTLVEQELRPKLPTPQNDSALLSAPSPDVSPAPETHPYDHTDLAALAAALDAALAAHTLSEAGNLLFPARRQAAKAKNTAFNGAASIQRLFAKFNLRLSFDSSGSPSISVVPGKS